MLGTLVGVSAVAFVDKNCISHILYLTDIESSLVLLMMFTGRYGSRNLALNQVVKMLNSAVVSCVLCIHTVYLKSAQTTSRLLYFQSSVSTGYANVH